MAISTWDDVIAAVRKSRLLSPDQLRHAMSSTQGMSSPSAIARKLVSDKLLTRWQAGEIISERLNLTLGSYRLRDQSGFTDLGPIYLAEHLESGKHVELKTLGPAQKAETAEFQSFVADARKVAALDHPNIAPVVEITIEHDTAYLVTEHIEGRNLQWVVEREHPLPPERAADYLRQVASGLAAVHNAQIVHGELRPDNLLLDETGSVRILGIGMASLAEAPPHRATQAGAVDYLAPEQTDNEAPLAPNVDLYALGCLFYFFLTGRPPFPDGSAEERLHAHRESAAPPITEFRNDVPPEMIALCESLLQKSPESRLASAADVVEELSFFELSAPASAERARPDAASRVDVHPAMAPLAGDATTAASVKRPLPPRPAGRDSSVATPAAADVAADVATSAPVPPIVVEPAPPTGQAAAAPPTHPDYHAARPDSAKLNPRIVAGVAAALVLLLLLCGIAYVVFAPDDSAMSKDPAPQSPVDVQDQTAPAQPQVTRPDRPVVAQVAEVTDCVWSGNARHEKGDTLRVGERIRFERGHVRIVFSSGGAVSLDGPADFEIGSKLGGVLHSGTAVPHVPEGLTGFAVRSPEGPGGAARGPLAGATLSADQTAPGETPARPVEPPGGTWGADGARR